MRPIPRLAVSAIALLPWTLMAQANPATPAHPGLCGGGTFLFYAAGAALGRETFEMTCAPDGQYTGTGHTQITLGAVAVDLQTTIAVDQDLVLTRTTAKGTAGPTTVDQTIEVRDGTATISGPAGSQQVPYPKGAAFLPNNIYYQVGYVVARYDAAKGGAQTIPVFGPVSVLTLERIASDEPRAGTRLDRYALRIGPSTSVLWTDAQAHVVGVAVPAQKFIAVLEPYANVRDALLTAAASPPAGAPAATKPADYAAPPGAPFTAQGFTVPVAGGKYTLAGTLLLPKAGRAPFPAVVTITGSGLQDRDESIAIPGLERYRPMRQIAEALAASGIAVLRVDDRGFGQSTGRETLATATTSGLAEDTRAQVAWLRARTDIDADRIALLGHSEGGAIAPMVAASDPRIAAIVLLAGPGKSGAVTSVEQVMALLDADPTVTPDTKREARARQERAVKAVLAGDTVVEGQPINAWTREYFAYDPLPTIRKVRQPILILQGGRDTQVEPGNATLLADAARGAGNHDVTVKLFPTLNHLFLPAKTGAFAEYAHLDTQVIGDDVIGAIRDWLGEKLGRK